MKALEKPLTQTVLVDSGRIEMQVTVDPSGTFYFRLKGAQKLYSLPIYYVFGIAVKGDQALAKRGKKDKKNCKMV